MSSLTGSASTKALAQGEHEPPLSHCHRAPDDVTENPSDKHTVAAHDISWINQELAHCHPQAKSSLPPVFCTACEQRMVFIFASSQEKKKGK